MAYPFSTIPRQSRVGILINTRERDGVRKLHCVDKTGPSIYSCKVEFNFYSCAVTKIVNV